MTKYRAGDVVLVRFPFTDMTSAKVRPAVVISTKKQDVIVIGVFSRVPQVIADTWVLLDALVHYFPDTGLKKTSVAKAEKIAVIDKKIIRRRIGTLPPEMMAQVKMAVKRALKLD
jgi:mRNA interferase MazF